MKDYQISVFVALAAILSSSWAHAQQATPISTEQMIEQLRPQTSPSRARGLRVSVTKSAPSLSLLIQFDFNSAKVQPENEQALSNLARALQSSDLAMSRFAVEGHTDAKGGIVFNQQLSQRRADAVREFLGQRGVDVSKLVASGKGASELANASDPSAPENRRVRIVNLD